MMLFASRCERRNQVHARRCNSPSVPGTADATATSTAVAPPSGPSTALRDVLLAACSQDAAGFSRFLTQRSKESFDRLTPAARVALMKRFVLLNLPGKAQFHHKSRRARPIVRCETPDVATEMSIGGADVRDNVAFMPLEIRDTADSSGQSVHQVNMGLVREGGQWRLLSLGLLLLDLPALEVEWDSAEADANEASSAGKSEKTCRGRRELSANLFQSAGIALEPGSSA